VPNPPRRTTRLTPSRLAGKRVLVTRAREDAGELEAKLRAAGAVPILAPAIEFGPPDDVSRAAAAVRDAAHYRWLVFTSVHGVDAFFAHARVERGAARIAAIGEKTAARVAQYGAHVGLVAPEAIEESLAEALLAASEPGDRILLFRAQAARQALPVLLRAGRRSVDDVAAYATREVRDPALADAARAAEIWTFTSGSTVRALVANVPGAGELAAGKLVACIGPVTAETARACGLPVHVTATAHDVDGLIAALECA
jgi:uroporphyrinogen-III synthase